MDIILLLRTLPWISSWEFCKIFRNGYGLDQLHEWLLLKVSYTTIYYLLVTGKRPGKKQFLENCTFQVSVDSMGLPLKQHGRDMVKVKTCSKNSTDQVFFNDLINIGNQCGYTFSCKKSILNVICKNGKRFQTSFSSFKATPWWKFLHKLLGGGCFLSSIIFRQ